MTRRLVAELFGTFMLVFFGAGAVMTTNFPKADFGLLGIALAEKFGKSTLFGVGIGLLGFIFIPILGFGDARYEG